MKCYNVTVNLASGLVVEIEVEAGSRDEAEEAALEELAAGGEFAPDGAWVDEDDGVQEVLLDGTTVRASDTCEECERSWGLHYTGPCGH